MYPARCSTIMTGSAKSHKCQKHFKCRLNLSTDLSACCYFLRHSTLETWDKLRPFPLLIIYKLILLHPVAGLRAFIMLSKVARFKSCLDNFHLKQLEIVVDCNIYWWYKHLVITTYASKLDTLANNLVSLYSTVKSTST